MVPSHLFLAGYRGWATILGLIESERIVVRTDPDTVGYILTVVHKKRLKGPGNGKGGAEVSQSSQKHQKKK